MQQEIGIDTPSLQTEMNQTPSLTMAVVETVAKESGQDPTELAPIHEHIDTDALDALFSTTEEGVRENISLSFEYEGFEVAVEGRDDINIQPSR